MNSVRHQPLTARCNWIALVVASGALLSGCASAVTWENQSAPAPARVPPSKPIEPVSQPPTPTTRSSVTPAPEGNAEKDQLDAFYRRWKGVPYRFGGNGRGGIDCSALTQRAMSTLGVTLPRTTRQQLGEGVSVSGDQVRVGDLVFFRTGDTLNHVGVMVSKHRFLHASTSRGVTISTLDERYWKERLTGYRRVLP